MKIRSGTFGDGTVVSNSLSANLIDFPEISKALIRQKPQYSFTYLTEGFGRYADQKDVSDRKFEWKVLGRLNRPMTCTGNGSGDGAVSGGSFTDFTVEFEENFANPYDILTFYDGARAIVMDQPNSTANGYMYTLKLQSNDTSETFDNANRDQGKKAGVSASAFPEKSDKGYEKNVFPDTYVNYLTTARESKSISGDAASNVLWIESKSGKRLWFFEQEQICQDRFLYNLEYDRWYGKSTVDTDDNVLTHDNEGNPIYAGDGVLEQIDTSNRDTYSGSLTEDRITGFIRDLDYQSGADSHTWVVFTGIAGYEQFDQAMKNRYVDSGSLIYDADAGQEMPMGVEFKTYHALGHKIVLAKNPVLDDPQFHQQTAANGLPQESHKFVFMDFGEHEGGVGNVEILTKAAGGIDRGFVVRYIEGMVNPLQDSANKVVASNAKDAFTVEYLTQSGIIIRDPLSCGILERA